MQVEHKQWSKIIENKAFLSWRTSYVFKDHCVPGKATKTDWHIHLRTMKGWEKEEKQWQGHETEPEIRLRQKCLSHNRRMDKQDMTHSNNSVLLSNKHDKLLILITTRINLKNIYNRIFFSNRKKENPTIWKNVDGPWRHYAT